MGKEKNFISIQKLIDKKVIDSKGSLLGEVKELKVCIDAPDFELVIKPKTGEAITVPWSDLQSVEDFIILKKTSKQPKVTEVEHPSKKIETPPTTTPTPPPPRPSIICQTCGVKAPGHAKFCPKCGNKLK